MKDLKFKSRYTLTLYCGVSSISYMQVVEKQLVQDFKWS